MIPAMLIPISMFALIILIITQFLPIPLNFRLLFSVFKKNNISYLNLERITFPQVILSNNPIEIFEGTTHYLR
jgi:hypothetical protein